MYTKNDFLKNCGNSIENIDKLYTAYISSIKSGRTIITDDFYSENINESLRIICKKSSINFLAYGFSESAERNLIAFGNSIRDVSIFNDSAKVLKISYNDKFNKLSHRDFLGSIMSLGFAREKMGDLVLLNNSVYVPVIETFTDYIIQNLNKVRNVAVSVEIDLFNRLPQKKFEILYKVVSSLRIDVIVSVLTNLSREKSKVLINSSNVKVNGNLVLSVDGKVCENDIIVIRGYGKFKIKETLGNTTKNKIKIVIDKFI